MAWQRLATAANMGAMPKKIIAVNDASFLHIEKHSAPMHVACMAIFSLPKDASPTFLKDLVAQWRACTQFKAPFNYRYRALPLPSWDILADRDIDLEYHFRHSALPQPGGERELGVLVSRLHTHKMDRHRPLWECHIIEGLEGGRFALYAKVHHSQVDGVGGIRLMQRMLATEPDAADTLPPWAVGMASDENDDAKKDKTDKPKKSGGGFGKALAAYGRVRKDMLKRRFTGQHDPARAMPFNAPKTILNGRVHAPRRFATQQYDFERIRAIAKKAEVSTNDIFLAISAAALRRYLLENNSLPKQNLTVAVPVSVRPADDAAVGNAISFILANLYTLEADPLKRLRAINHSVNQAKAPLQQLPKAAMNPYTAMFMGPYVVRTILGLSPAFRPMYNVTVSNVPGPAETRYLNGAAMQEIYPVSLLFSGQAINITLVSYDGKLNLGFTGCRDSLPSMQRIAVYTGEAVEELEAAVFNA